MGARSTALSGHSPPAWCFCAASGPCLRQGSGLAVPWSWLAWHSFSGPLLGPAGLFRACRQRRFYGGCRPSVVKFWEFRFSIALHRCIYTNSMPSYSYTSSVRRQGCSRRDLQIYRDSKEVVSGLRRDAGFRFLESEAPTVEFLRSGSDTAHTGSLRC